MRIHVLGGGPSGLYFAYLMKSAFPGYEVRLWERNSADVTFGFGVVLSGRAKEFISEGDKGVVERIGSLSQSWSDQHIVHCGETVVVDGSAFSGIARIDLLRELQGACRSAGVEMTFGEEPGIDELDHCDVLVGADGANSTLRDSNAAAFGTRITDLRNYYAWYGVAHPYPAHTLTFAKTAAGCYCAHHYRYRPGMSTFVAEADAAAWQGDGLYAMSDDERRGHVETLFADTLGGQPLVSNRSIWRRYRLVTNDRWAVHNMVLIGDALRTAHPSIGSGTRLAMEDAIALWRAFAAEGSNIEATFRRYQSERQPIRDRLDRAAERSIDWYERMGEKMDLSPYDFTYDYLMRTGVMTPERLERFSPDFMARWRAGGSLA